ncbi:hypothetical protein [Desulfococcus sp.]|uniref:hypothetical protein n=1 Tax=Desulfococcus sp. TaxID=2025834 RepID=UPI0035936065
MKIKKRVLTAVTVIMGILFTTPSAWAGSKQRHRWEGVAIGVGAAVLGGAILSSCVGVPYAAPPVAVSLNYVEYEEPPRHYYRPHKPYRSGGRDYRPCCGKHHRHHHKQYHRGHGRHWRD